MLDLQLYRLAKMAIEAIREELEEKLAEAERIEAILASQSELWAVVRSELVEIRKLYGEKRRTEIGIAEEAEVEYSETDFIIAEQAYLIVTRGGWIKRQGSFTSIDKIRIREGDEIGWVAKGSTKNTVTFFTDQGAAYVMRLDGVPSTSGYGEPIQRHFGFSDGERVVGIALNDPASLPEPVAVEAGDEDGEDLQPPPPYGLAMTLGQGRIIRFPLALHSEISNRSGRRYARLGKGEDGVIAVAVGRRGRHLGGHHQRPRAVLRAVRGDGGEGCREGVTGIKLAKGDQVMAFALTADRSEGVLVHTNNGREEVVRPSKYSASRAGKGRLVIRQWRLHGLGPRTHPLRRALRHRGWEEPT